MTEPDDVPPPDAAATENQDRYLILMRHAKSDWGNASLSDHHRPLNARGKRDAPRMADWLSETGVVPDVILSSTSERTRETVDLMTSRWGREPKVAFDQSLYLSSPDTILSAISAMGGDAESLMVVAHNPGISYLVSALSGESIDMPTAAIAIFKTSRIDADWAEIVSDPEFQLVHFMRPKAL